MVPDDVPHLLDRIDEATAYALGKNLGSMYIGFVENIKKQNLSFSEERSAITDFLVSFWLVKNVKDDK